MQHSLVCPLVEERSDGVRPAVQDQENGWLTGIGLQRRGLGTEGKETALFGKHLSHSFRQSFAHFRRRLVPDRGTAFEGEQETGDALHTAAQAAGIPRAASRLVTAVFYVQRKDVGSDCDVIRVKFLHIANDFVLVRFGQQFDVRLTDNVAKV